MCYVYELLIDFFIFDAHSHIPPDTISHNPPSDRNLKAVVFPQDIQLIKGLGRTFSTLHSQNDRSIYFSCKLSPVESGM